jgi:DNA-binding MarR family transcriptional regulator
MQTPNGAVGATEACAAEILDVVPTVMRFIRTEMRGHRAPGLSIPQFRTLMYVHRNRAVSLSGVAEHLGLTPASTSTLVDGLSRRGLLLRTASESDRRRICLSLTATGQSAMESIRRETRATLAAALSSVPSSELQAIGKAMTVLRRTFAEVTQATGGKE